MRNVSMARIRSDKRLAIYLRDGLACVWCDADLENDHTELTLDHLQPHSRGGSNHESNLITVCRRCSRNRQDRSMRKFAEAVAGYLQGDADAILRRVRRHAGRKLTEYRQQARQVLADRE